MLSVLLELLYHQGPLPVQNRRFFEECLEEMAESATWSQVYHLLRQTGALANMSDFFRTALVERYHLILGQNLYIRHQLQTICEAMEKKEMTVIPLKGTVFAEHYFGNFAARGTSDIDLLIRPENLPEVVNLLRELGFEGPRRYNPLHFHCLMQKTVKDQPYPLNVELHWAVVKQYTSEVSIETFWKHSVAMGNYHFVRELALQDTFYAICLHGANHRMESIRFSLDIAHLIYRFGAGIDYSLLFAQAKSDRTFRRVYAALATTYKQFPGLHNKKALPHLPMSYTLSDHLFLRFPLLLFDNWKHPFRELKEWVWPRKSVALWFMKDDQRVNPSNVYFRFYRRRFVKLWRILFKTEKGEKQYV